MNGVSLRYDIRQLEPGDITLMKGLLRMFGEAFEELSTYQDAIPDDVYIKELLAKGMFIALAAVDCNEVIGGIAAYELPKFEQIRKEIYIYDLAVSAQYRRKGIATALINKLRTIAVERGAYVIIVQSDNDNEPAISLYDSLGSREVVYHFDIDVGSKGL